MQISDEDCFWILGIYTCYFYMKIWAKRWANPAEEEYHREKTTSGGELFLGHKSRHSLVRRRVTYTPCGLTYIFSRHFSKFPSLNCRKFRGKKRELFPNRSYRFQLRERSVTRVRTKKMEILSWLWNVVKSPFLSLVFPESSTVLTWFVPVHRFRRKCVIVWTARSQSVCNSMRSRSKISDRLG